MEQSFETFFKVHEQRIYYQMNRLNIPRNLHPEFYAQGIVALWQAYQTFNPEHGNLGTYLNYRIRFRLIDLIREQQRQLENDEKLKEKAKNNLGDGNRNRADRRLIIQVPDLPLSNEPFWKEVRSHLTLRQWKWVKYFIIAEMSIKEIMEIEGVSADAVKSWGRAVRRKLRDEKIFRRLQELL